MKTGSILRFLLPVVVLAFLLGILSVFVFDMPAPSGQDVPPSGTPALGSHSPLVNSDQTTVLVIGIDAFSSGSPRLLAVWWATFDSFYQEITLFGLPIDAYSDRNAHPVFELFRLNNDRSPTSDFLQALEAFAPAYPDVIVVLDEEAFAQVIDFMGGVVLEGDRFDGQSIVTSLQFVSDDPQMLLSMQASLLLSLSFQGAQLGEHPEITSLTALIPDHAYSSIQPTTLVNLLIPMLPLDPASIQIEVWQP